MPVQAIPLALAASLYPLGIAALLLLTEAARARSKVAVFVAGAVACTLPIGFVGVFAAAARRRRWSWAGRRDGPGRASGSSDWSRSSG